MPTNELAKNQECTVAGGQGYRFLTIELTTGKSASVRYNQKNATVTEKHQVSVTGADNVPGIYRNDGPGSVEVSYQ